MKILLFVGSAILVLVGSGFGYQQYRTMSDNEHFPPPGKLIEVDGTMLHLDCRGQGSPIVVMESGLGNSSVAWYRVMNPIAERTRVCAYDRPGLGWSEPQDHTNDAAEVAGRLDRLLSNAGENGPAVMVGWSAGGVYIRAFQRQFPERVVGMVFVDSSHEQQGDRLPTMPEGEGAKLLELCTWLQPIGVVRALGIIDNQIEEAGLPAQEAAVQIANANRSHFCRSVQLEGEAFTKDIKATQPPTSLDDMPIVVLTQGKELKSGDAMGMTLEQAQSMRTTWNILQKELAGLSSRSNWIIATESGHEIASDQPELVINAINEVLDQL